MVGEYRRMSMMSSSLVLSRGGIGNSNSSLVEMGNNEHHQSYYTAVADPDESGRHRSKSYKGGGSGGGNKNGKVHLNNVSSSGQRDVLKPKSRTAASSSTCLVTRQNQEWLYRIGVALLVAVASQSLKCHWIIGPFVEKMTTCCSDTWWNKKKENIVIIILALSASSVHARLYWSLHTNSKAHSPAKKTLL